MRKYLEAFLAKATKAAIQQASPTIIAITGSVGKTTTRQMVLSALQHIEEPTRVISSKKNFNNELGLPLTVFGESDYPGKSIRSWARILTKAFFANRGLWKLEADVLVLEMGADKPGDLALLTSIAQPDISIVTGVTPVDSELAPVHQEFYPTAEAVAEEKSTLVKNLREGGIAILNADDNRVYAMRHLTSGHILGYGENEGADIRLVSKRILSRETPYGLQPHGVEVVLECYHKSFTLVFEGVFGTSIAYSACAAAAVCVALDIPEEKLKLLPITFERMAGRVRIIDGIKQTTLFDDTYNAAPAATVSALRDLASVTVHTGQKKIACLGEHRELGEKAKEMHYRLGVEAAKANVDVFVVCGIFATAMKDGALAAGLAAENVHLFEDTPEAALFLQEIVQPGDIVLAKASQGSSDLSTRGVRMERVIKELMAEPQRAKELLVRQEKKWLR